MTTRDALETALAATPDDVALHSAYADLLLEQGDPRGEYIRLQLAAEDRAQPPARLRELETAAHQLLLQHEREWLGELWPYTQRPASARSVAEPMEPNVDVRWRRGWIDSVRIGRVSEELPPVIAAHPLTRLLASFAVAQNLLPFTDDADDPGYFGWPWVPSLIESGRFANVRHFELGSREDRVTADGTGAEEAVESMPRLESIRLCVDQFSETGLFGGTYPHLHTIDITYNNPQCRFSILGMNDGLPNLRRLSLDTVGVMPDRGQLGSEREPITPTDLQVFFRSRHLNSLEYLTFRNGEFGDAGVEELLASGFVTRLRGLDLCRCNITDDGARLLAAHPHVRRLEYLHLDNNLLSPIGLDSLEAVGVEVSRNQFFGPIGSDGRDPFDGPG